MNKSLTYILATGISLALGSCSGGLFSAKAPVTLKQAWASENTLRTPESVVHDVQRGLLYVSNINKVAENNRKDGDGFISKLNTNGEIETLYWVTGLNDPKGIALFNSVLYIADIDEIIAVSTQTGAELGRYKAEGAGMLNDVTIDNNGNVFVSDSQLKRIYTLQNGRVTMWMENTNNERPNGLFYDSNRIVVAFASNGDVKLLDPESKRFTEWSENMGAADGIAPTGDGNYFISNWHGEIYYVNTTGKNWKLLDTKEQKMNTADISYSQRLGLLLVPTFFDNRLVAYTIEY